MLLGLSWTNFWSAVLHHIERKVEMYEMLKNIENEDSIE